MTLELVDKNYDTDCSNIDYEFMLKVSLCVKSIMKITSHSVKQISKY